MKIRMTPVNGYDIPALERWLERMAARGLLFAMTAGPLTLFEAETPQDLQFHLEPARDKTDREDPELNALYEEAGWRYLGIFRKNYYVFATEDKEAQAHTDADILAYALKRFFRQKLLGGVGLALVNFLLLNFFRVSTLSIHTLRYEWAELLAGNLIPCLLTALGLILVDLAYFHGLWVLWRLHRLVKKDLPLSPAPGTSLSGKAVALSILPLTLVAVEMVFLFATHGYFPYDLTDSNFVTMTEIEGEDFQLTGDILYNMDYISHGNTPLTPESWYFRQWGASPVFTSGGSLDNIPHLEINITRYLLPAAAEHRAWEWQSWGGHDNYRPLEPTHGLDGICLSKSDRREGFCYLILRQGRTVMRVEYQGTRDITQFILRFAQMMEGL